MRTRGIRRAALLGAVCCGLPAQTLKLSLRQAVDLALHQNLDVQTATVDLASRQQERIQARADLLPQVGLGAAESIRRFNLRALIGQDIPGKPKNSGPFQAFAVGPVATMPIFDLTLFRKFQASASRVEQSRRDEQTVREGIVLLTVSQYMAHLRALASVTAAESRVQLAEKLAGQAGDLHRTGVATAIDVSRAQVRVREEKQRLIDSQLAVRTSLTALLRLLNLPQSQAVEVADASNFFQTPGLDVEKPVDTALNARPEIQALDAQVRAAAFDYRAAVAKRLPTLTFTGQWTEQGPRPSDIYPGYEYRFNFYVPLFTSGRLRSESQHAALARKKAELKRADTRNRVTQEVLDAEQEIAAARQQVDLARQQVGLANDEVTLSEGRFRAGVTDNIEVVAAQDSLARANDAEIGALYRYNLARAELAHAVGRTESTYGRP